MGVIGLNASLRYGKVTVSNKDKLLDIGTFDLVSNHLRCHFGIITVNRHSVYLIVWHLIIFQTAIPFNGHSQVDRLIGFGNIFVQFAVNIEMPYQIGILWCRIYLDIKCVGDDRFPDRTKVAPENISAAGIGQSNPRCCRCDMVRTRFLRYQYIAKFGDLMITLHIAFGIIDLFDQKAFELRTLVLRIVREPYIIPQCKEHCNHQRLTDYDMRFVCSHFQTVRTALHPFGCR